MCRMANASDEERWKELVFKAKRSAEKEQYEESLTFYRQALAIKHNDKLASRIKKLEVL